MKRHPAQYKPRPPVSRACLCDHHLNDHGPDGCRVKLVAGQPDRCLCREYVARFRTANDP